MLRLFFISLLLLRAALVAQGQVLITSITTSTSDAPDTVEEGITFLNQSVTLSSFRTSAGIDYGYASGALADRVEIRRSGASGSPNSHVWYQTTSAGGNILAPHVDTLGEALLGNNAARAVQNLFGNGTGTGAYGNIERVDFIFDSGYTTSGDLLIPIFDIGAPTAHDPFKIALITSLDALGNPSGYSTLAGQASPWSTTNVYTHDTFSILRYNTGDTTLANYSIFTGPNQGLGGVAFGLSDFGVAAGSTVYGYSLFGYDVTDGGNSSNLLSWTNGTYFPTNTSDAERGPGSFDFAGINGIFFTVVPEPSAYALGGTLGLALFALLRRRKAPVRT